MSAATEIILDRFREKCRMAGGLRVGFVLRKDAILYLADEHPDVDFEAGLGQLVEDELLKVNESGDFYFLSATGAEKLGATEAAA